MQEPCTDCEQKLAAQKAALRTSLDYLSTHAQELTNRLAASEAAHVSLRSTSYLEQSRLREENQGLRALCVIWETRWREERRLREDEQNAISSTGNLLNHRRAREETRLVILKPTSVQRARAGISQISQISSDSGGSCSASSASTIATRPEKQSRSVSRRHALTPKRNSLAATSSLHTTRRLRIREFVDDLARELERVRREADDLLAERDAEIGRLEADRDVRKDELARLYQSLETLCALPRLGCTHGQYSEDGVEQNLGVQCNNNTKDTLDEITPIPSVLDLPTVKAAALLARDGQDISTTVALEDEIRQLELEVAKMTAAAGMSGSNRNTQNHRLVPGQPSDSFDQSERAKYERTVIELNEQINRLQQNLSEVQSERSHLRQLLDVNSSFRQRNFSEQAQARPSPSADTTCDSQALVGREDSPSLNNPRRIAWLEAELHRAHDSKAAIRAELSATQAQFEAIADRVRLKLLAQKRKLAASREDNGRLRELLEQRESRLKDLEKVVEGVEDDQLKTNSQDGSAVPDISLKKNKNLRRANVRAGAHSA